MWWFWVNIMSACLLRNSVTSLRESGLGFGRSLIHTDLNVVIGP